MQEQIDYSKAIRSKYPEQIVIAIAKDKNGKANPVTIGWTMIVSGAPPMMAIALAHQRYSTEAVRHSRCFTVSFPSEDMAELVLFFGTKSGRDIDKFAEFACATEPAKMIDSVLLSDAVANFECVLESETPAGDHVIFVGKVIASYVNSKPVKRLYTLSSDGKFGPSG